MGYTILTGIWEEVDDEIDRARKKFGALSMRERSTETAIIALQEEVGEVSEAIIDRLDGRTTRDGGRARIRQELIQTAAGAIAMVQKIDELGEEG